MTFTQFTRFIGELMYGGNEDNMKAIIQTTDDGRAALYYKGGALIQTYSRERDAKRGAERLGLEIIG